MSIYDTAYYKDSKKKYDEAAEADIAQKVKDAEERKAQINATLDQSAAAQTEVYEQAIADAPLQSRALYDQNALDEALNRKKIQETLANMGMTDSGLSSSMHTALAVQKSRADNQVRAAEYQTVRAYEAAIDQILADTEAQKASAAIEIDQGVADYRLERKAKAESDAASDATTMYNADLEAYTAQQKQLQDNQSARIEYVQNIQKLRSELVQQYVKEGMKTDQAMAKAYTVYPDEAAWKKAYDLYPDTSTVDGVRYAYYNQLSREGYGDKYASAMSTAYANAVATGKTEAQVAEAISNALLVELNKTATGVGVDLLSYNGAVQNINQVSSIYAQNMAQMEKMKLTTGDKKALAAYLTGAAYFGTVQQSDSAGANKIGKALERIFSGPLLEVALLGACLE